jgi:hypothetical protein
MNAKPPESFGLDRLQTPIGIALLVTDADGVLRALDWEEHEQRMRELLRLQYGAVALTDARSPTAIRRRYQATSKANSIASARSNGGSRARRSSARSGPRCRGSRQARR